MTIENNGWKANEAHIYECDFTGDVMIKLVKDEGLNRNFMIQSIGDREAIKKQVHRT